MLGLSISRYFASRPSLATHSSWDIHCSATAPDAQILFDPPTWLNWFRNGFSYWLINEHISVFTAVFGTMANLRTLLLHKVSLCAEVIQCIMCAFIIKESQRVWSSMKPGCSFHRIDRLHVSQTFWFNTFHLYSMPTKFSPSIHSEVNKYPRSI